MLIMNKKMLSGIEKLDKQHENIITGITDLKTAIINNAEKEKVLKLVEDLNFYANDHFEYEEVLAEMCDFYRIDELKDTHNDFRHHYQMIKKFYNTRKSSIPIIYALHTSSILEDWIEFHFEYIEYEFLSELKKCMKKGLDISNI